MRPAGPRRATEKKGVVRGVSCRVEPRRSSRQKASRYGCVPSWRAHNSHSSLPPVRVHQFTCESATLNFQLILFSACVRGYTAYIHNVHIPIPISYKWVTRPYFFHNNSRRYYATTNQSAPRSHRDENIVRIKLRDEVGNGRHPGLETRSSFVIMFPATSMKIGVAFPFEN